MKRRLKVGRRTLCTSQITTVLCKYISSACTIRTACEATGISQTSVFEWIRRGETGEKPFAQFAEALARAKGQCKAKLVKSIIDSGDPRLMLEMLARIAPDEYARCEPRTIIVEREKEMPAVTPKVTIHVHRDSDTDASIRRFGKRPAGV